MGVLLQGFFKLSPNHALPSPADGKQEVTWWWDHLAAQARSLSLAGFTAIWLPPVLKTASGANQSADGYGPFDDYDIGSRSQKGTLPTRYGSREQLQRCVSVLRANGLDVYLDMVEHQRVGDVTLSSFGILGPTARRVSDVFRKIHPTSCLRFRAIHTSAVRSPMIFPSDGNWPPSTRSPHDMCSTT
jgi:hypothetical protein